MEDSAEDNRLKMLFDAIENNELNLVKGIVHVAAAEQIFLDINSPIEDGEMAGMTALALATNCSDPNIVVALLRVPHIDANIPDKDGRSPLFLAVAYDQEEIVARLLVESAIDVNFADDTANTPLSKAIECGNINIVYMLLQHPEIDVNMSDNPDRTPLAMAYMFRKLDCMFELLDHPRVETDFLDSDGIPFLNRVCASEKADVVKRVLGCPNVSFHGVDPSGATCLHSACANIYRDIEVLHLVLQTFDQLDVNTTNQSNETPLFWATHHDRDDAVAELLLAPGIDANIPNKFGETPLHHAVASPNILKKLLCVQNIEVNARTMHGETALFLASSRGVVESLKLLLRHPCTDLNIYSEIEEMTPVAVACENGHEDALYELISAGADVHRPNKSGKSPVSVAAERGHTEIVDFFVNKNLVDELLIPELVEKAQTRYYAGLVHSFNRMHMPASGPGSSNASVYVASYNGSSSETGLHSTYLPSELDMEEKRDLESVHSGCDCCAQEEFDHAELEIEYFIEFYFCDDVPPRRIGRIRSDSIYGDPCAPGSMLVRRQHSLPRGRERENSRGEGESIYYHPEPRPFLAPLANKSLAMLRTLFIPRRENEGTSLELVSNKADSEGVDEEALQIFSPLKRLSSLTSSLHFWPSRSRDGDIDEDDGKDREESPPPSFFNFKSYPERDGDTDEPKMGFFEPITPGSDLTETPRSTNATDVTPGMKTLSLDEMQSGDEVELGPTVFQIGSCHNSSSGSLSPTTCIGFETFGDEDVEFDDAIDPTCANLARFDRHLRLAKAKRRARGHVVVDDDEDVGEPVIVMAEPIYTRDGEPVDDGDTPK